MHVTEVLKDGVILAMESGGGPQQREHPSLPRRDRRWLREGGGSLRRVPSLPDALIPSTFLVEKERTSRS
uniref:Uncharacterized protein n=1 Tax=Chromera velia CCMP2878 TaxID=1169474 RepID=A0A0G4HP44_9ALVE|eukprot:Cvel_29727.t1-p1 / transcript=Cvel_29727.t1 / gene=Cvel_29727 / organism=Chromera_velia_CCMP2878 / gene_product=hypothetical protein / transcript_product=hypothetical protein / location=Cvel_scaffold4124:2487-3357(-) / protein_length=69 / sequence_SO=supercontig / SO=protein_coding / is_pseudo=false